ncbi:nuclear transport factor 2 family protein [Cardiobacterium sp. AH-315-I02]|nr:nuclear transport factor 2 family protein [Cardiobacterium sp. AH-315-I02]
MNTELAQLVEAFFKVIESKDIEASLAYFSEDASFIDPHYPRVHMKGKKEIEEGLTWGFKGLKKLGFTIEKTFYSEDGKSLAVEVATAHELPNGKALNFPQAFIIEIEAGKITRLQAYEPYGPHGIFKIILAVTRFINKILRKT